MMSPIVPLFMKMFTIVAMTSPIRAMKSSLPNDVRSVFVKYPTAAITANVPAVMKNTCAMDDIV